MSYFYKLFIKIVITICTLVLVGSLPFMFGGAIINFPDFISGVMSTTKQLFTLTDIHYISSQGLRPLLPDVLGPYLYSMSLLIMAFTLSLLISITFTCLLMLLPKSFLHLTRLFSFIMESIPDIFIAVVLQLFIIWFYKETNILLFNVASYNSNTYAIPIICLSILPSLTLIKILIFQFEEELQKNYVSTALGKGLSNRYVVFKHILINTFFSLFFHSKEIFWMMLSNLLIIEFLFNIYGLTSFIMENPSPIVFITSALLLLIPINLLFAGTQHTLRKKLGNRIGVS